jgi:hypothetical protein
MSDWQRVGLLADILDTVAGLFKSRLTFPLVVLMIGTVWIIGGWYGLVFPAKMAEASKRMRWVTSDTPSVNKALSCVALALGCVALSAGIYFVVFAIQ